MSYTKAQLTTKLQTLLRDDADIRWTAGEKSEILDEAYEDSAIVNTVKDTSLTASTSTQTYAVPETIDRVTDVYIADSAGKESRVAGDAWEQRITDLIFRDSGAPSSGTLVLIGIKQYTSSNSIPVKYANYILYTACLKAYELLMNKYVSGMLMADVSMAELQQGLNYFESKIARENNRIAWNNRGIKI